MENRLSRAIIDAIVRNSVKQIKKDPERSIRKVIDMALSLSNGRFQKHLLETAQTMLEEETSCYYKIIPDLIANVDEERIVTVGMNIGYNSCSLGAQTIREIETREHFNIPWSVFLEMDKRSFKRHRKHYHSALSQGKELGIYTWTIHALDNPYYTLELAEAFPEYTFLILCSPENITPALLDDAKSVYNVAFIVEYTEATSEACNLLRSQKHLFSVFYKLTDSYLEPTLLDEILSDTENLNALFTIFSTDNSSLEDGRPFYEHIQQIRSEQKYRTIPFDFLQDNCYIDSIISEQACAISFFKNGTCHSLDKHIVLENCNLFHNSLSNILKVVSSKN